jgi:hypothetical protein
MDRSPEFILHEVLNGLMSRYTERVPDVKAILHAMTTDKLIATPADIENDHIAFRTLAVPHLGISSFEKIFLHYGYKKRDHYFFSEKKLDAWWYAPPMAGLPRIFVSELRVVDLPRKIQDIIYSYTRGIQSDPVDSLDLNNAPAVDRFLHSGLWRLPNWTDYNTLARTSEYAAWAIYNRYYLNHFTISIHNLPAGFNDIESFTNWLLLNGFKMNDAGGMIKTSADGLLRQSSTVASLLEAEFADGSLHAVPGSYVEFAERKNGREGFEAANADKIFESTFIDQINKGR